MLEAATISTAGAIVHARELAVSTVAQPDVTLPRRALDIHLISHRKTPQRIREVVRTKEQSVLGIDLRAYAKIWWEICDEDKEQRLKEVAQARGLMRQWLAEQVGGRGWLQNAEYERRATELRARVQQQQARQLAEERRRREQQHRREQELERQRQEAIARFKQEDGMWRIPEPDAQTMPSQDEIGWIGTSKGLMPKTPDLMKPVRSEVQGTITNFLAADIGLHWHETRRLWCFVGTPFTVVPSAARRFLDRTTPWEVVTRSMQQQLRRAVYTPPASQGVPKGCAEISMDSPPRSAPDTIVRNYVGTCVQCGAPTHEVILDSGPYAGKHAIRCSRHERHPITICRA